MKNAREKMLSYLATATGDPATIAAGLNAGEPSAAMAILSRSATSLDVAAIRNNLRSFLQSELFAGADAEMALATLNESAAGVSLAELCLGRAAEIADVVSALEVE